MEGERAYNEIASSWIETRFCVTSGNHRIKYSLALRPKKSWGPTFCCRQERFVGTHLGGVGIARIRSLHYTRRGPNLSKKNECLSIIVWHPLIWSDYCYHQKVCKMMSCNLAWYSEFILSLKCYHALGLVSSRQNDAVELQSFPNCFIEGYHFPPQLPIEPL